MFRGSWPSSLWHTGPVSTSILQNPPCAPPLAATQRHRCSPAVQTATARQQKHLHGSPEILSSGGRGRTTLVRSIPPSSKSYRKQPVLPAGGQGSTITQHTPPNMDQYAPSPSLQPLVFLHFLTLRKPQKRNCIKINSHSPREAEPDTRTLPAAPTLRSALQQQHALLSEDTTVTFLHLLLTFLQAFFKGYRQHLGLKPPVQLLSPSHSEYK